MSGALGHIDSLMVDWTDDFKDGMQRRPQVDFDRLSDSFPVLVGNNRVYDRCGC